MLDFFVTEEREGKRGVIEILPSFQVKKSSDIMIRGHDFYAIWDEDLGLWSTDEDDAIRLIDRDLDNYANEQRKRRPDQAFRVLHLRTANNRMIKQFHTYCKEDMFDHYVTLDEKFTFANTKVTKRDHVSKRLAYSLERKETPAYDRIMSTLYSPDNRHKIEWAYGCVLSGDGPKTEKFLVLYGAGGTGKGTALKIGHKLFDGYDTVFDAKNLVRGSSFPLEAFKNGPLVAIQYDGDLSRIEDNATLNSIVSHEPVLVNTKYKSPYTDRFKCFLFLGTNRPVKITDARSGLIRRLIDVAPTGKKIPTKEYDKLVAQIDFELGGIAQHCLDVYNENPGYYNDYIPYTMMGASDYFYNFVADRYLELTALDYITGSQAFDIYQKYCDYTNLPKESRYRYPPFKEELKEYFTVYEERHLNEDGTRTRSWYSGFKANKIEGLTDPEIKKAEPEEPVTIVFDSEESILDKFLADQPAQYANAFETPSRAWDEVSTKLSDIDTRKLHYVRVPKNLIVIDFDIPDQNGEKSLEANLEAASKFPPTYAELSKSGKGIHLHYIYDGDPEKLAYMYADHVEIKAFTGKASLRRQLSKCNSLEIAHISSGLPLKGEKPVVNDNVIKSSASLQRFIVNCLHKKYEPHATKPMIDFIYTKLEEAYASGMVYDVSMMRESIRNFALGSTHNAEYCMKVVSKMKFKSETESEAIENTDKPFVIFDVEVFPNLFMVCWKPVGPQYEVICWINPTPEQVRSLYEFNLIGFNNRRYDNHILWAAGVLEFNPMQLYLLSQRIISGDRDAFFREAYNLSYTDIYDFSATKQSLKKFEVELGVDHLELGLRWDQPVPEELWHDVAVYCKNDVISTEAVWTSRQGDFAARKILAALANVFCKSVKSTVNDTTNTLTTRIIFGDDKNPQSQFKYRFLGDLSNLTMNPPEDEYNLFDQNGMPVFKGYKFEKGVSTYRGEEIGEGGYVYAEPGMYGNVALLDIASMHPSSVEDEELFGPKYTPMFSALKQARIYIKHGDLESAGNMLDGALKPFLSEELAKDLSQALKIAINSVYGLTAAKFPNAFKDPRNVDNIVAKRGALFMVNLKHEVQKRGFIVAHIKTDSIKIPDATPEIIQFVMDYGKWYGYTFEHEDTYDRMCLVNDAVYIAKYKTPHKDKVTGNDIWWTATGTQFQVPYVFKTLFSKEPIKFEDLCETKSVTSAIYLDFNENLPEDEHEYKFVGKVGKFSPVKDGCDGGLLLREGKTGYAAVTGTKGYRWKESEILRTLGLEDQINREYYETFVKDAIETISTYVDFTWFVSDDPYIPPVFEDGRPIYPEEVQIN